MFKYRVIKYGIHFKVQVKDIEEVEAIWHPLRGNECVQATLANAVLLIQQELDLLNPTVLYEVSGHKTTGAI